MIKQSVLLTILFFIAALQADPPEQTWIYCDAITSCPDQMTCVKFEDMDTPVCWPVNADPCERCGKADCSVLESYPPQINCGESNITDPEDDPAEELTACKNDAGYCEIGETSGYCECVNGMGQGWASADGGTTTDPSEPPQDGGEAPVFFVPSADECMQKLIEICGDKAPDLKESCGDRLGLCVDATGWVSQTCYNTAYSKEEIESLLAGIWTSEHATEVYQCCTQGTADEIAGEFKEIQECIETKGCEQCLGQTKPGNDPEPATPCMSDADCKEGYLCINGLCSGEDGETPAESGDTAENSSNTGGTQKETANDYGSTGANNEQTPGIVEKTSAGCALTLL